MALYELAIDSGAGCRDLTCLAVSIAICHRYIQPRHRNGTRTASMTGKQGTRALLYLRFAE